MVQTLPLVLWSLFELVMFKGILPVKRIPSSDFSMITNLVEPSGKENMPNNIPPTSKGIRQVSSKVNTQVQERKRRGDAKKSNQTTVEQQAMAGLGMHKAFDKLLDELQIPSTLRPKLVGMDDNVKAAMLKSSQTMALNTSHVSTPSSPRANSLRRAHSIESITSLRLNKSYPEHGPIDPPIRPFTGRQVSAHHVPSSPKSTAPRKSGGHVRGLSFDPSNMFSRSQVNLPTSGSASDLSFSKLSKEKPVSAKGISPSRFFSILSGRSSTQLDVEDIKKLRLLLRNETASWSQEFLALGGYSALLTRLNEILEVEWREEQHDDQVLHELLRCFKALSTSSVGCSALRSSCPMPFTQLIALLYSDKKPGDVATRQLIADLLLLIPEIFPPSSLPSTGATADRPRPRCEVWERCTTRSSQIITLPPPHKSIFSLIRALLLTAAPPPVEAPANPVSPHEFIESLHRPRIYKTYLQELSDICRDYFWVFCHPNNTIWVLSETDERKVEKPRAPGGMTGGVEFEAIGYFTTHLRLINAIARAAEDLNMPKDHDYSSYRFHCDLFLSGFERIILIARKASMTYYPSLHLELSRYIAHALRAGCELPYTLSRLIGPPPPGLAVSVSSPTQGNPLLRTLGATEPTNSGGPSLPSSRIIERIRFE